MKTTVEYTEAEFIALVTLAEKFTDRMFRLIEAEQAQSHAYRASVRGKVVDHVVMPDIDDAPQPTPASEKNEFGFHAPKAEPLPKWATSADQARDVVAQGHQVMCAFTEKWMENLGVEGAPQPDRAEMIRSLSNGPDAGSVMAFMENKGGLLHALDSIINLLPDETEASRRARVSLVGSTMCQISSIYFFDFSTFYEHVDIYRKKDKGDK